MDCTQSNSVLTYLGSDLLGGVPLPESGSIICDGIKVHGDAIRYSQLIGTGILLTDTATTAVIYSVRNVIASETAG